MSIQQGANEIGGCVDRAASRKAGVDFVPVGNGKFAALPAKKDRATVAPRREVNEAAVDVFECAPVRRDLFDFCPNSRQVAANRIEFLDDVGWPLDLWQRRSAEHGNPHRFELSRDALRRGAMGAYSLDVRLKRGNEPRRALDREVMIRLWLQRQHRVHPTEKSILHTPGVFCKAFVRAA